MCCSFNKIYIGSRHIAHCSLDYFEKQMYQSTQANIVFFSINNKTHPNMQNEKAYRTDSPRPPGLYLRKHRFLYRSCLYAVTLTNGPY